MTRILFGPQLTEDEPKHLGPPLWIWGWLGLLAFLVFELTAEPALGFSVFCLRFGWEDLRTARWLRRVDSWRARASICRWFLWARGSARISVAAFCVLVFWLFIAGATKPPRARAPERVPMPEWFPALVLVLLAGLLGTAVFGAVGVWRSRRARLPVWLDPILSACAAERRWPPSPHEFGTRNLIDTPWLILLSVWLTVLFLAALVAVFAIRSLCKALGWPAWGVIGPTVGLGVIGLGIVLIARVMTGVRAHQPAECWQRTPPESPGA